MKGLPCRAQHRIVSGLLYIISASPLNLLLRGRTRTGKSFKCDTRCLRETDLIQGHWGGDRTCVQSGAQRERLTGMQAGGQGRTKGEGELAASLYNINKEPTEPAAAAGCLTA